MFVLGSFISKVCYTLGADPGSGEGELDLTIPAERKPPKVGQNLINVVMIGSRSLRGAGLDLTCHCCPCATLERYFALDEDNLQMEECEVL